MRVRPRLPELTTKERHRLESVLPDDANAGTKLQRRLGYLMDKERVDSLRKLEQWVRHHRYVATFVEATT